jgi:hypothetical protein
MRGIEAPALTIFYSEDADMNDDWFLIVEVGAEGGTVGLAGRQDDAGGWEFRLAAPRRARPERPSPRGSLPSEMPPLWSLVRDTSVPAHEED